MRLRLRNNLLPCRLLVWTLFLTLLSASPAVADRPVWATSIIPMWHPQPQFAGYYMAREKKIYEKSGLDVTIVPGGSKQDPVRMLKEGKVAFAILDLLWALELRARGMPLVNVGQIFQKSSIEFVVRKDSGINHFEELEGRRVAVWKNRFLAQTLGVYKEHAVSPIVFPVSEGIEFFLKRAVDSCAIVHYNEYKTLINYGLDLKEMTVFKLSEMGLDFPEDGIYCMADTLYADKEKIRRFVNASLEGWKYAMAHPEETVETLRTIRLENKLPVSPVHVKWMMNQVQPLIVPPDKQVSMGRLLESDYDRAVSFLIRTGRIKTAPAYDDFYYGGE